MDRPTNDLFFGGHIPRLRPNHYGAKAGFCLARALAAKESAQFVRSLDGSILELFLRSE
jgi:hypothetical protein